MFNSLVAHPYLITAVATFIVNNIVTVMVGSLPAPTAQSTPKYVYWFKVANGIVGNLQRAKSTSIEQSPNFLPAVEKYLEELQAKRARIIDGAADAAANHS